MTGIVLVSQIMLWLAVAVLGMLVLALARQVGVLHERIAPAGALTLHRQIKVGDAAPAMTLQALGGEKVRIGAAGSDRSQVLVFVSPECPTCKTLPPIIRSAAVAESRWADFVLAGDGDSDAHRAFVRAHGLQQMPLVLSPELGRALGVSKLPYAVLIDAAGKIAAFGLVNTREHLESLFEAKERGVESIQQHLASADASTVRRLHAGS